MSLSAHEQQALDSIENRLAYRIWSAGGTWYARRHDRDEIMQAGDPERLSFVIRDDYFHRAGPPAGRR